MADDTLSNTGSSATQQLSETCATTGRSKLTLARIIRAIRDLAEKGGSTASSISKLLQSHYGMRVSSGELKKMLIRACRLARSSRLSRPTGSASGCLKTSTAAPEQTQPPWREPL
eukprot:TRINITY_DN31711_c0_g1_i21.p2 TRINITY_DN31711_c0_g1~~TRINITY_DN31711_c0_g1_i21.p2  ORF type:complete len:115 (-),score=12.74 TRINITY_DN31711_c0_g1_i21:436-780(-)